MQQRQDNTAGQYWLKRDVAAGVMLDPSGAPVLAFPESIMLGLIEGLEAEGKQPQQWMPVLYRCGELWGRQQMTRLETDLSRFFQAPPGGISVAQVHAALMEAWAVMGWGRIKLNPNSLAHGFLHVVIKGALLPCVLGKMNRAWESGVIDPLTAGTLAGMFAAATNADITAHQIACELRGDPAGEFVVGLHARIGSVPSLVNQGRAAAEILRILQEQQDGR